MRPHRGMSHPVFPLLAVGSILTACSDKVGVTPPDPRYAVGPGSEQFVVNTTEDSDGCDPDGECSLRGAIAVDNSDPEGGPYTIVLTADETYTLTTMRPLDVHAGIVIKGNGATIDQP